MKRLGKQPRRHDFFLNPYRDWRFSSCPQCGEKTRVGTLDRAIWRQSRKEPMPIGELLDHLYVFAQVLQFEPEHYGWVHE